MHAHARLHNFPILADWKICGLRILTEQTIKITFPPQLDHNYTASSSQADKSCTMRMFIDGTCYTYLHYTCTMCTVQCTVYSVHTLEWGHCPAASVSQWWTTWSCTGWTHSRAPAQKSYTGWTHSRAPAHCTIELHRLNSFTSTCTSVHNM